MHARFTNFICRLIVGGLLVSAVPAFSQTPPFSFFARHDIPEATTSIYASATAAGLADFNGDGLMDIVMAGDGTANVMLATGPLTYATTSYSAPGLVETVVIGDFNNDGHPDFAMGVGDSGGVFVYINNGNGTFTGPTVYPQLTTYGLATADVNNDGNLDLIGQGFVMLGLGNGKFETSAPLASPIERPAGTVRPEARPHATSIIGSGVAVADLNGDGNIDVVETDNPYNDDSAGVYLGNGNGTFRKAPKSPGCAVEGNAVAIGDFNNDGIPDIAFPLTGKVAVCLGNGDGTFQKAVTFLNGYKFTGQSIVAADLNGDGNLDIAVVDSGGEDYAYFSPMSVLYGNGDGTFQAPVIYDTASPSGIAVGDLNGDGRPDVVVAGGEDLIYAFLGTAGGKLEVSNKLESGVVTPESVAVADFNGDGNLDLAVTGSKSNTVSILLGNGNDGFTPAGTFATGPTPTGVAAGDFNGDGKMDVAVVNAGLDNVSILLGNGDGTLAPAVNYGAGETPAYIVTGDFNGDGKLDLAVTNTVGNNVSILLGNGDGTFGQPKNFATGKAPQFITAGDLNGDGKLDLAVANSVSGIGTISVLFGNGDGTFQPALTLDTAGNEPAGIAIADFNGDTFPDIVVANFSSTTVSVFLGNGAGSFQSALTSPACSGISCSPWTLVTGDFNGDGHMDLAVVAYDLQDIALLPGLGNGQFGPATFMGADALPYAIASAPLRAGKPNDLVVINQQRNIISVLTNTGQ